MKVYKENLLIGAAKNPGQLVESIFKDIIQWALVGIVGYAVFQFILAMIDFMSKEPQKHAQGKDHAVRACIGLVGAFSAGTIMAYLKTEALSWVGMGEVINMFHI